MTARLPARYGANMSLPSMVQDSVSDWSQAWLFSNWSRLPVRSWSAPAAAYLETRVLPSSTTSGGLEPDLDGVVGVGLLPLGVDAVDDRRRGAGLHQPDGEGAGAGLGAGLVALVGRPATGRDPEDQGDGQGEGGGDAVPARRGHGRSSLCWSGCPLSWAGPGRPGPGGGGGGRRRGRRRPRPR